jgi:hypothetical protein
MGDLLKFASFFISFSNSSPVPVTCTCHLWQKKAPLTAGGSKENKCQAAQASPKINKNKDFS